MTTTCTRPVKSPFQSPFIGDSRNLRKAHPKAFFPPKFPSGLPSFELSTVHSRIPSALKRSAGTASAEPNSKCTVPAVLGKCVAVSNTNSVNLRRRRSLRYVGIKRKKKKHDGSLPPKAASLDASLSGIPNVHSRSIGSATPFARLVTKAIKFPLNMMEKIKLSFPPPSSIIWRNKVFCFPQGEPHFHDLSRQQMTTSVRYERWLHSERRIKSADLGYVGIAPGFKCVRGYGTLKKKKMVRPHSGMRQRSISTCRGLPTRN